MRKETIIRAPVGQKHQAGHRACYEAQSFATLCHQANLLTPSRVEATMNVRGWLND